MERRLSVLLVLSKLPLGDVPRVVAAEDPGCARDAAPRFRGLLVPETDWRQLEICLINPAAASEPLLKTPDEEGLMAASARSASTASSAALAKMAAFAEITPPSADITVTSAT